MSQSPNNLIPVHCCDNCGDELTDYYEESREWLCRLCAQWYRGVNWAESREISAEIWRGLLGDEYKHSLIFGTQILRVSVENGKSVVNLIKLEDMYK